MPHRDAPSSRNRPFVLASRTVDAEPLPELPGSPWWFVFRGAELLVRPGLRGPEVLPRARRLSELGLAEERARVRYLGHSPDAHVYAVAFEDESIPDGFGLSGLRALHGLAGDELFALAGRAWQILEWDRTHRFCGHCGTPTEEVPNERAKLCPECGLMSFPRLSPAVIVLVERGDEVLLARHTRTTDGMYALVAGFVEPGESIEEAVGREVQEEVGIDVDRLAYFGSQPWPFPNQLMIGFTAQYAGGEIAIDGDEIADACWFSADALPRVPPRLSIARKLIDAYAAKHGVVVDQP